MLADKYDPLVTTFLEVASVASHSFASYMPKQSIPLYFMAKIISGYNCEIKKWIGYYMSTEWKQSDCLKYCKNYKKSACYLPDQLILLRLINLNKIGIKLRKRM